MTDLTKPIVRRIGNLVIRVSREGISIKRLRCKKWFSCTWVRLASMFDENFDDLPCLVSMETNVGKSFLNKLKITLSDN